MISSEFRKEEYWQIKGSLLSLVLSLILSSGLLFGLKSLDAAATAELRSARNDLNKARDDVDKIEEEEARIIEYVGRYQQMEEDGVLSIEDRLQFQETLAELRTQFNLFPVSLNIQGQTALSLEYPESGTEQDREIILHTSLVELSLPLLHENDLTNLLQSLVDGPGMLQPLTCSLTANSDTTNYIYLAQHFDAACSLNWYTFQLPPPEGAE
jgi:hypothetical protein